MRRLFDGLALLALTFGLLLVSAPRAAAHAELVESEPGDGETVAAAPETLTATFSEPLGTDRSRIVVVNFQGDEVARGGIAPDNPNVMIVEFPPLPAGAYAALWVAVTPDDGGVTRGTISFTVATLPIGTPGTSPGTSPGGGLGGGSPSPSPSPAATRPGGMAVITLPPGVTPRPSPTATATPPRTPTPAPTARPTVAASPILSPSPTPAGNGGGNDLLIAIVLATVIVGGLGVYLLRR